MKDILNKIIAECPKAWAEFNWFFVKLAVPAYRKPHKIYKNEILLSCKTSEFIKSHFGQKPDSNNLILNFDSTDGTYNGYSYNFRNWYDYFDGLEITISIIKDDNFVYVIFDFSINGEESLKGYTARAECEWNAFYEAFKIREQQLTKDNK